MKTQRLIKMKLILWIVTFLFAQHVVAQSTGITDAIDQHMTKYYSPDEPGAVVLVAQGDRIIFKKGYGKASLDKGEDITPEHIFRIGSLTKQFTAAAILKLVNEGKIRLNDKVTLFLPDYRPQGESITIENLLNHTSGVPNYTAFLELKSIENKMAEKTLEQRFSDFNKLPLEFNPGEQFKYSNSGYFILGMIVEKVSGISYGEYIDKNFFGPLKMKNSFYDGAVSKRKKATGFVKNQDGFKATPVVHHSMPFAAGALASTVEDLWKWNRAVFDYQVVPRSVIEKAWQSTTLKGGEKKSYGYGWSLGRIDELKVIDHGGAIDGYVSYVLYVPDEKLFVGILSNKEDFSFIGAPYDIARVVLNRPIKNPVVLSLDEKALEDYTGHYQLNGSPFREITRQGMHLFSQSVFGKEEILPYKKDCFFVKDAPTRFEFVRDGNNQVISVLFSWNEWEMQTEIKTKASPKSKEAISMNDETFDVYAGEYEIAPGFIVKVWRQEKIFMVQAPGQKAYEILPENNHSFFVKGADAGIEFLREDGNNVTAVIVTIGGRSNKGKKIK